MADIFSSKKRSEVMSAVKSKNTALELLIRKELFARGFRYKIHDNTLPGKPDLVFPKYKAAIFVNGCFWHKHSCKRGKLPLSNREFWKNKIGKNKIRDKENEELLLKEGWRVLIIWECAVKGKPCADVNFLLDKISEWLIHGNRRATSGKLVKKSRKKE